MFHILNIPDFGDLDLLHEYDYYNGPLQFSCMSQSTGQIYVAHIGDYDDTNDTDIWLYAEVSGSLLKQIENGEIEYRQPFMNPQSGRILKLRIPTHQSTDVFHSEWVSPNDIDTEMFPIVGDYVCAGGKN